MSEDFPSLPGDDGPATPLLLVDRKDPVLWTPAAAVTDPDGQVLPNIRPMLDILKMARGLGLSAPQVGIGLRFFLGQINVGAWRYAVVVNPEIKTFFPGRTSSTEGCLSFGGRKTFVARHDSIFATWTDHNGKTVERTLYGQNARVFAHEFDHLNGVCIFPR